MPRPRVLRFFCELDRDALAPTFTHEVVSQLQALGAGVTLGLRDLSSARADLIRQLNASRVPVGLWVLLPLEDGYFATHHNAEVVSRRCDDVVAWVRREGLVIEALGLDFEPDLRELGAFLARPLRTAHRWARRAATAALGTTQARYTELVDHLRSEGFAVETYQFPLLLDDRARHADWWQRFAGSLDVAVSREVVMLYSSLFGALGPSVVAHFAPRCRAIGVGSTGGGVDPLPKLEWRELARDLRVAAAACDDVSIFSLEGCVEHGHLERLRDFDWNAPLPPRSTRAVAWSLEAGVWLTRWLSRFP
jgi:hypothetical protein